MTARQAATCPHSNSLSPDRFRTLNFHLLSLVFDSFALFFPHFCTFGLSASDRFGPSVFALSHTIRLLPFSGCHLDSSELCRILTTPCTFRHLKMCFGLRRPALFDGPPIHICHRPHWVPSLDSVSTDISAATLCLISSWDDRQITHPICVRLRLLLYDYFAGYFGPFIKETTGQSTILTETST